MTTGIDNDKVTLSVSQLPIMARHASRKPNTKLPASPMNMRAIGKLYLKNPRHEPAIADANIAAK